LQKNTPEGGRGWGVTTPGETGFSAAFFALSEWFWLNEKISVTALK
jgi:hypothetical protein